MCSFPVLCLFSDVLNYDAFVDLCTLTGYNPVDTGSSDQGTLLSNTCFSMVCVHRSFSVQYGNRTWVVLLVGFTEHPFSLPPAFCTPWTLQFTGAEFCSPYGPTCFEWQNSEALKAIVLQYYTFFFLDLICYMLPGSFYSEQVKLYIIFLVLISCCVTLLCAMHADDLSFWILSNTKHKEPHFINVSGRRTASGSKCCP